MKKLLVVLLSMVLVIGMATSAFAFTDTDDLGTVQQDGIYRLSALGVLNGYPDGTFGADNQITRAEFAKIACITAGLGDVSDVLKNTPARFSDVKVGAWYTGYVNVAASQGFINGYPDGTFKPNQNISMAEVVTILMRIAGYNDNLPGPWPFDYIAEAGKQDVTDDVTFVSNVPATRADVAVMTNNLLDVVLVDYDSDLSKFVDDEDDTTVLDDSFGATVLDVMFDNAAGADVLDAWTYSDFEENEITLSGNEYDDATEGYNAGDAFSAVMNADCYITGGMGLTGIAGMTADVITNDDDEVIYVKVTSSFAYTDDVEGTLGADTLEVDGDEVDAAAAGFAAFAADNAAFDYAKVFYNEDGDAYAVLDLDTFAADAVVLVDEYDAADETLVALVGGDQDLEDADVVVLKDGEVISLEDLEQNDVVYVFDATNGADHVLVVDDMVAGALTEGSGDTITVGGNDYDLTVADTDISLNGADGTYSNYADLTDLEDAWDTDVELALHLNPYIVAYLVGDVNATTSVYGIVTDITVGGLFDSVQDVTILNQEGTEVTYDVDDDVLTFGAGVAATDIELGCYVDVNLDADGVIDSVEDIILADAAADDTASAVSSSKIQIGSLWYKITSDTLIFETVVVDGGVYADSTDFDEANLIDAADLLAADDLTADAIIIASADGATIERLFVVDSSLTVGDEGYSFVDRLFTNSSGDFVELLDGTVAEQKNGETYTADRFFSYQIVGGELDVTLVVNGALNADSATDGNPVEDGFWVLTDGTLAAAGATTLAALDVAVDAIDGDDVTLAGDFYTLTADTAIFTVSATGVVEAGDADDITDESTVLAISDEDANLMFVFVLPDVA